MFPNPIGVTADERAQGVYFSVSESQTGGVSGAFPGECRPKSFQEHPSP